MKELEQFCFKDWAKIPVAKCAKPMETYLQRLEAVINTKGDFVAVNTYEGNAFPFLKKCFSYFFSNVFLK